MNLVIDVGNTLVKIGIFEANVLKHKKSCVKLDFTAALHEIEEKFTAIDYCIVASVANLSEHQLQKLHNQFQLILLDSKTPVPFKNLYATPLTLGIDRVALVSAAVQQYPGKNVLVIDAGTCITYDFLNAANEYLGGAIAPGLTMRYKALNAFTERLPLLEATNQKSIIGNSTAASIHTGVEKGVLYEIDGFIESYKEIYENLTVILTGGDAHFLRDSIKNDIFANSNFLLEGLNHILEYNKH